MSPQPSPDFLFGLISLIVFQFDHFLLVFSELHP
ncbi:hypothetical protein F383_15517 [Gossypium arboreum]|uniref:Uncharacterized protein n=1 Tax=Gossypium arboreum TaxID=29729 RepID=A0A0B0N3Z7_GOSAR|nr:hypothetical protein F383_15517 [Gossypium arboreum]